MAMLVYQVESWINNKYAARADFSQCLFWGALTVLSSLKQSIQVRLKLKKILDPDDNLD